MKLLPWDHFCLNTTLPPAQLAAAMRAETQDWTFFAAWGDHKTFQGTVTDVGFKVTRVIGYRNSFVPVVVGEFRPSKGGADVDIRMRMNWFVLIFSAVWFGPLVLFMFLGAAFATRQNDGGAVALIALGIGAIGYATTMAGFWFEARKARRILTRIISGDSDCLGDTVSVSAG